MAETGAFYLGLADGEFAEAGDHGLAAVVDDWARREPRIRSRDPNAAGGGTP